MSDECALHKTRMFWTTKAVETFSRIEGPGDRWPDDMYDTSETVLVDLLTNLLHLGAEQGHDPHELIRMALWHYEEESEELCSP